MRFLKSLPPTIIVLGVISLLNDISSEMIYPLLPLFLVKELGAGPAFLGLIEGVAESAACLVTLAAGVWADRARDRSRVVLLGYALASAARSMMAFAPNPLSVLLIRLTDRVGKGIRTAPRDAIMADAAPPAHHGRVYGFHRTMDNTGAVAGPLIASFLLAVGISKLRSVFAFAAIPAVLAVALVAWKLREPNALRKRPDEAKWSFEPPAPALRSYLAVLFLFSLSQSSDVFLLLRASGLGIATKDIPLLWTAFNLVKSPQGFNVGSFRTVWGAGPSS